MVEKPTTWKQNSIWNNGSEVHILQKKTRQGCKKRYIIHMKKKQTNIPNKSERKKTDIKIKQIDHIERIYHRIWHFNWLWNTKITPFILIGCQNEIFVLSKIASFLYYPHYDCMCIVQVYFFHARFLVFSLVCN